MIRTMTEAEVKQSNKELRDFCKKHDCEMSNIKRNIEIISDKAIEDFKKEVIKKRYWKEWENGERITYIIEKLEPPHDERCEGTMCWCAKREEKEKKKVSKLPKDLQKALDNAEKVGMFKHRKKKVKNDGKRRYC